MHALATAEDLATYLNEPVYTAHAEYVLELTSDAVRQTAGQQIDFGRGTYTLPVTGRYVILPQRPVIIDDDNPLIVTGYAPARWRLNPERTALHLHPSYLGIINITAARPAPEVTITYSHGYPPEEIPRSLQQIVLAAAARHLSNPEGLATYSVGGTTATWKGQGNENFGLLTDSERTVIRRFFGGSQGMLTIA